MKYIKPSDSYNKTKATIEGGMKAGIKVGFHTMDKHISFKKGYTTLLYGAPRSGKSQLAIECMNSMSIREGTKNLVYMPEAGSDDELLADIIMNYLGKCFFGDNPDPLLIDDFDRAIEFVDKHYTIIPQRSSIDLYSIYRDVKNGICDKPDIITIDHVGWLRRPDECRGMALFDYVRDMCQKAYLSSNILNLHSILINHTSNENKPVQDKDTKIWHTPKPLPEYVAFGSEWQKNSYQMMSTWRPKFGLINEDFGIPYEKNEVVITVDKSKPKGIGEEGKFSLFFDVGKQRYYEKVYGSKYYAGDFYKNNPSTQSQPELNLLPSKSFNNDQEKDGTPF